MVKEKDYIKAWLSIFSILNFFIAFFTSYFTVSNNLVTSFIRAVIVYIVSFIVGKIIIILWKVSIPKDEWLLIVHGKPKVDSRSQKRLSAENIEF